MVYEDQFSIFLPALTTVGFCQFGFKLLPSSTLLPQPSEQLELLTGVNLLAGCFFPMCLGLLHECVHLFHVPVEA